MKIHDIHEVWGSVVELSDPTEFFHQDKNYWRDLIYRRKLIIFKRMNFSELDFIKFNSRFGMLWQGSDYDYSHEKWREIVDTSTDRRYAITAFSNKLVRNIPDMEMPWHADIPNRRVKPFPHRSLWMINNPNPETSGHTRWLNIEDGISSLNPELLSMIHRITVQQQSWYKEGGDYQIHNFVKKHPITGRSSLRLNYFVGYPGIKNSLNAWIKNVYIDGVQQPDQSLIQTYIDDLLKHSKLVYQHKWDLMDIAIYDNYPFIHGRSSLKLAVDEHTTLERKMMRINVDHMTNAEWSEYTPL